jgi:hypothetical protein
MKPVVLIPALVTVLCAISAAQAMQTVPYLGPAPNAQSDTEANRLTGSNPGKGPSWGSRINPIVPYLSLAPSDLQPSPEKKNEGPGFLNADPFDPNSVVNRFDRSLYANPFPYDPVYNPYGQGTSTYAPRGGTNVPMGNGIPYGRR